MKKEQIQISKSFTVSSGKLYKAWLSSKEHSAFTGGKAKIQNKTGCKFTAWDNYISGEILELDEGKRILQFWRTTDFPKDDEDSILEILLGDTAKGCKLTLKQWNIPGGQGKSYKEGWVKFYFEPMAKYFNKK